MDILCIGSAVLDITARPIESQDMWREKQRISEIQIQTGGDAANQYLEAGAGCVVIKCGSQGCYLASAEGNSWIPAVPVEPVDTTGAGDCMVALFISRILSGDTPKEACRYACVGASLSTLFPGASGGRLTEERLKAWREEHQG